MPDERNVAPMPPRVDSRLPWVGAGIPLLQNPTRFFEEQRRKLGETYLVDAFGNRLFCVFSPEGVRRLYELPEDEASFGIATFNLLKAKVPIEIFLGRRNRPHDLFGNQEVERYVDVLEEAVDLELEELGDSGRFEVFDEMRRLGHRLGLGAWAGTEAASPRYLDRLIPLFNRLDSADSFVQPIQGLIAQATKQARERRAQHGIEAILGEILAERCLREKRHGDFLDQIWDSFADVPEDERPVQVARDVMVLHMGAQSNLYAALAWTFVNVILRPTFLERIRDGDDVLLEKCANESIRMAQRSITLRHVLEPVEIDDGRQTYRVGPGVLIATMLSVTNVSCAAGLETFEPDHYQGRRLAPSVDVPTKELVSTFGHGRHSCPAQRFAITAIRISTRRLLERFDFTPEFSAAEPKRRQLGGVARSERPCPVRYARRHRGR
ncbi:MAG: cytochrome P450 [Candidatus Binatia bacterium]|nr:cytochrome P450 [Candidatus Binatia bacterium]